MVWTRTPPVPMPPSARVYMWPGAGQAMIELTSYLSQETNALLTSTIESPTTTNQFTVADVTLKGYDPNGTIRAKLAAILPSSTDFTIFINLGLFGSDSSNPSFGYYQYDVGFNGFIAPATVQINAKDKSFTFTVIGEARKLQTTSAASLFQRSSYYAAKWTLQQDAAPADNWIRVTGPNIAGILPNYVCDFLAGDRIQINGDDSATVVGVDADVSTSPPTYWQIQLESPLGKQYAVGASVVLLTPYQRNLTLESVVTTLFDAAGFPPGSKGYFSSPPLPNLSTLFASPLVADGLPVGPVQGAAPGISAQGFATWLFAGTALGLYRSTDQGSTFTLSNAASLGPLIDDNNIGSGYIFQNAPRRIRSRANTPRYGLSVTFKFYAYDGKFYGGTNNRYCLTVTCNADVDGLTFVFASTLSWETQNVTTYAWTAQGTLQSLASGTTTTDLSALYDAIGIEVDSATGTCFFTDLQNVSGAGSAITMNTSAWQPTGATIATGLYQANKATGVNGPIVMLAKAGAGIGPNSYIAVTQTDGVLGKSPNIFAYSVTANGTMTPYTTIPCSPYLVGRTIKLNRGDWRYYALISDPEVGISIMSWAPAFALDSGSTPILLAPPPPRPTQSQSLLGRPYDVDLYVMQQTNFYGTAAFPFVANFSGSLYSVSQTFTNVIAYVDMTGLSVADALQQLSLINAGIFYVVPSGWVFRSRAFPAPGATIGTNVQIDDTGMISLTSQGVFNRWLGYVRFENENDKTIYGEAGDTAFADTDQGLSLKSRFIPTSIIAKALAQSLLSYLGTQKRWIEIERVRDGRVYEVGRTFYCTVDGASRQFQIIETGHPVTDATVKVVGLEV